VGYDEWWECDQCEDIFSAAGLDAAAKEAEEMKTDNKKEIVITKYSPAGPVPNWINFAHRRLEKEGGGKGVTQADGIHFSIPVDLLSITLPQPLVDEIESVEVVYQPIKPGSGAK